MSFGNVNHVYVQKRIEFAREKLFSFACDEIQEKAADAGLLE